MCPLLKVLLLVGEGKKEELINGVSEWVNEWMNGWMNMWMYTKLQLGNSE